MICEITKVKCILEILQILSKGKSKYTLLFKETKVSHTTLQNVLKEMEKKNLIEKQNIGHQKVDYFITKKGNSTLEKLLGLKVILS